MALTKSEVVIRLKFTAIKIYRLTCRLKLYFWLSDGQLVTRYAAPNHSSKSLSKKRRMLRKIEFRSEQKNLEQSEARLKTADLGTRLLCHFLYLSASSASANLQFAVESIKIRTTH